MWVVYRKSDGKVIAATETPPSKDRASLEEIVRGLEGSPPVTDFEAAEVKDSGVILGSRAANRRQELSVRPGLGGKMSVIDATPDARFIQVTTNAKSFHPVDNVPLLTGNGQSFLVVTLQKVSEKGTPLVSASQDDDVVWLRTSHGSLREDGDNAAPIRSVTLANGTAKFRLYSENAKRLATVQMLTADPDLSLPALQVEFT